MSAQPSSYPVVRPLNIFILHPSMLLTDHRPSGDGLLAFEFIKRLALRGHTLHVAVSLHAIEQALSANIHLHELCSISKASPFGASLPNRVEFGLRAGRLLRLLQQTIRFDLVHQLNPVVYGLAYFAPRNLPLVMGPIPPAWPAGTEHKPSLKRRMISRVRAPMLRHQFSAAARVLPANDLAAEQLQFPAAQADRLSVLPFGVDTDLFSPKPGQAPATPTILFLSNLWKRKGIFTLLDAFVLVHASMPQARLVIAGTGSDADEVAARIQTHPARHRITLAGHVSRADVPDRLRQCTVFCVPSFGEPFGMAALEAMSCGIPFVGTRGGGLAQLASSGGSLLVEQEQPESLAEALLQILSNPLLAGQMGRHNARYVRAHFSWDLVLNRLEAVYKSCLREPGEVIAFRQTKPIRIHV